MLTEVNWFPSVTYVRGQLKKIYRCIYIDRWKLPSVNWNLLFAKQWIRKSKMEMLQIRSCNVNKYQLLKRWQLPQQQANLSWVQSDETKSGQFSIYHDPIQYFPIITQSEMIYQSKIEQLCRSCLIKWFNSARKMTLFPIRLSQHWTIYCYQRPMKTW